MSQSPVAATLQSEQVSPEGTQERKNTYHLGAIRLKPLPMLSPEKTQHVKTQHNLIISLFAASSCRYGSNLKLQKWQKADNFKIAAECSSLVLRIMKCLRRTFCPLPVRRGATGSLLLSGDTECSCWEAHTAQYNYFMLPRLRMED